MFKGGEPAHVWNCRMVTWNEVVLVFGRMSPVWFWRDISPPPKGNAPEKSLGKETARKKVVSNFVVSQFIEEGLASRHSTPSQLHVHKAFSQHQIGVIKHKVWGSQVAPEDTRLCDTGHQHADFQMFAQGKQLQLPTQTAWAFQTLRQWWTVWTRGWEKGLKVTWEEVWWIYGSVFSCVSVHRWDLPH